MTAILTVPPTIEPLSIVETKAFLKLDETVTTEDALLNRLIIAARQRIEKMIDSVLIEQTWTVYFDCWPQGCAIEIPIFPASAVLSVKTYETNDAPTIVDPADYVLDLVRRPARLVLKSSPGTSAGLRKLNAIEVIVIAGFGPQPSDVPEPVRQAMLMLIAHWYEIRQPACSSTSGLDITEKLESDLAPYRVVRL